jgi:protein involved in polysaccharide export with SLBB domain
MKKTVLLLLTIFSAFAILLLPAQEVSAQGNINFGNIQSVNVDNLSDGQILNFYRQMQAQGFSVQEVGNIARARGMPPSEVSKLMSRLSRISTGADRDGTGEESMSTRAGQGASLMFDEESDLPPLEQELLISELRRLVQERNEEELVQELDMILEEGFPVFGANLFSGASMSFEPSLNIPTPRDYIFGPGDEIRIDVWGAAEQEYTLVVEPDGNIRIPNVGPVRVASLEYTEARERILRNLKSIYSGLNLDNPSEGNTYADVALGNVRSVNVSMIGEVRQPGSYTVSSLATVFNMLYAAGGPNRSGSWRSIQIIRGDSVAVEFDLYDLIVHANQKDNVRVMDNDIIRVRPYLNRVRLNGEVKRPGMYELKDGETLSDLMEFAGGFAENAYKDRIVIRRKTNIERSLSDVKWPEGGDIELRNGDEIEITPIVDRYENRVRVEGAVYMPGDYELTDGMYLSDLIEKAEGVKENAYLERALLIREMDNMMLESIPFSVRDIIEGNAPDIELQSDDLVRISSIFDLRETFTIQVSGAVNSPDRFEFLEGMSLEDAIYLANGLRDEAAAYRVDVARRVVDADVRTKVNQIAEVYEFEIDENFRFSNGEGEFKLQPFDRVFVRTKPNYQRQLTVRIEGEVQFPGEYVLENRDSRLSDLIQQAGGLSQYAFTEEASMQRILNIRTRQLDDEELAERSQQLAGLNLENVNLDEFRTVNDTVYTPVGIRLDEALRNQNGVSDLRIQEGDIVIVPRQLQTVRVEGGVLSPVTMRYVPGRGLQNYIDAAGGTTDRGQRHRAYIVYANGEVDRVKRFLRIRSNPSVEAGSTIVVPEKPASRELTPQERISLASSIASTALLFITILDRVQNR